MRIFGNVVSVLLFGMAISGVTGCAHSPLSARDLDSVVKPAFVARISAEAGPKSHVFAEDATYTEKLQGKMSTAEADSRLAERLLKGKLDKKGDLEIPSITRFEVADSLRAEILAKLPKQAPWTVTVDPAQVGSALESLLVTDEKPVTPEYERLKTLGADVVVDLLIEEYGMRSELGRTGCYVIGTARFFKIDGGELYHRRFFSDEVKAGLPGLNPFQVAEDPTIFRDRLRQVLRSVGTVIAADLNPSAGNRSE